MIPQTSEQAVQQLAEAGGRLAEWMDDRLGMAHWTKKTLNKIFPDHWSFMIGEIALYSFIIVVLTGVYLTFFFNPSLHHAIYHGPYKPLDGQPVSDAYASVVNISLYVRGGLVIRQMHHWSADIFIGAIVVHMCRIFFTGAFRRPRELNWMIGVTLLFLSLVNGYLGYSLPDDLISGTGLRIMFSVILAIPVVGTYFAFFFFGGNFPGTSYDFRLFIVHVFLLPAIIAGLLAAHLGMLWHQKHTQFRGSGATERNVVGSPVWPQFAFKTLGLQLMIFGIVAALGGLAQINPIWLYGPYLPYRVSYLVQPDWYMGWLDGALRLMPSWEVHFPGHMIPNLFFPAIFLPGITTMLFIFWPFLEAKFTKENLRSHHLLDRPRDRPVRTAIGVAVLAFYSVLFLGSATDLLANFFSVSLNAVLWSLRVILVFLPIVTGYLTYWLCKELSKAPEAGERKRANIVVRTSTGGYAIRRSDVRPGDEVVEEEPEEVPAVDLAEILGAAAPEPVPQGAAAGGGVLHAPRGPAPRPPFRPPIPPLRPGNGGLIGSILGRRRNGGDGRNGGPPANRS
ncbi:MAG: cytochrome bc1 complex cytochrome b subunit [Acidimicrobiales bacterium]